MSNKVKMYKPSELAKMLDVSHQSVLNWVRRGKITVLQLPGKGYRIPEPEVERIMGNIHERKA